jgi:hypothetical protein
LLAAGLVLKELTHILRVAGEDYVLAVPGGDVIIFARVDRELPSIHQEDVFHQLVIALRLCPWHIDRLRVTSCVL